MVIECVDAYVDVGGVTMYKGTHCWVTSGGGGPGRPSIPGPTTPSYKPDGYPKSQGGGVVALTVELVGTFLSMLFKNLKFSVLNLR